MLPSDFDLLLSNNILPFDILSDIVVQVAGSPTNISQLEKEPKHQSEYIQKLSEVFQRFAETKWLLILHAHVIPKSIKII